MVFFDREWQHIGTRAELATTISRTTGIKIQYLNGKEDFRKASSATKFSWQARRKTTVVEDVAYSLVGVLDVQLVPIYGEGLKAFQRLQEEILRRRTDESIFAWTTPD
ncbi:Vegetative incompatibility protein HET-E-1, partial [Lachnellula suecica]